MSRDTTDDVTLSDGHTKPATAPDPETNPSTTTHHAENTAVSTTNEPATTDTSLRSAPGAFFEGLKHSWRKVGERLPIPVSGAILLVLAYFTGLLAIGLAVTPFHAFGIFSATTGVIILASLYHPAGAVKPETLLKKYVYPATGLSFILVGLRYLLMGVLFRTPFF